MMACINRVLAFTMFFIHFLMCAGIPGFSIAWSIEEVSFVYIIIAWLSKSSFCLVTSLLALPVAARIGIRTLRSR